MCSTFFLATATITSVGNQYDVFFFFFLSRVLF